MMGGGALEPPPPSDLDPKGANRRETWHTPQKLRKENELGSIFHKNCIISYDNLCKSYA